MKNIDILIAAGIILFCSIIGAGAANDNGTLNIIFDNKTPLLYNAKSIQVKIVNVENGLENIVWESGGSLPFNRSFSLYPGIYRVYVQKDNSTIIEFNNDTIGYIINSQSTVDIPGIQLLPIHVNYDSFEYSTGNFKDIFSDIPWRINKGENIPIIYLIKNANEFSSKIRTISIFDDGDRRNNEAEDTLVLTHTLGQSFTDYLWFDYEMLSPSLFNISNNSIDIHVKFDINGEYDVHNFYTTYVSPFDLPYLENWSYGDTHYHSSYTDNFMEVGAPIISTQIASKATGIDWVTITDHSFDLDENRWNDLVNDSNNFSTIDFQIFPSEEISCRIQGGIYQKYGHYLAYGITRFIPGGEWEDGTGSHYTCDELVSVINSQGGFGYPAHPHYSDEFRSSWLNYSLDFRGLEIWNGVESIENLEKGLDKWTGLLLAGRKIFIEAGSDAHGDFNSDFGKVRTAVYTPYVSDDGILSALKDGHSVITDGPIVVFDINNTIIGDTIEVSEGDIINLNIKWNSTAEFGNISNITVVKGIIGDNETIEQEIYPDSYSGSKQIFLTAAHDGYYRLASFTSYGHRVYTNPVWVKIHAKDIIVDGSLTDDAVNRTWNTIQKGIDNASESDIIHVLPGTYRENIIINKTLTLIGAINASTIIDGTNSGNAVYLSANNVNISGFKIINASSYPDAGIYLNASGGSKIYNNFFNNTNNFNAIYSTNVLNTTMQAGLNIIGGPFIGGNFWANPGGTGFSQTCRDVNGDGICDSIYFLDSSNIDHLPLARFTKASIKVVSPNGGENWSAGTTEKIKWKYKGNPGSQVKIELLKGKKKIGTIKSKVTIGKNGKGSYKWSINSTQQPGTDYKIRIVSRNNPIYKDKSNRNFTISEAQ